MVCAKKTRKGQLFLTIDQAEMASTAKKSVLLDLCRNRVKSYADSKRKTTYKDGTNLEYRKAAVLVPIFLNEGSLHVLLTLRSELVPTHKGQVAFPGGKQEDDDKDIVATALREAQEEVGLPPQIVEVIAVLNPLIARTRGKNMHVYPVIGIVKSQFDLVINSSEVQTTFEVPLEFFLFNATHKCDRMTFRGKAVDIHLFDYETSDCQNHNKSLRFNIWGLTASICLTVAIVALNKLPEFELKEPYSELVQYITEFNSQENDLKPLSKI